MKKNKQNEEILDVCVYYDKRSSAGDIYWKVKVMILVYVEI